MGTGTIVSLAFQRAFALLLVVVHALLGLWALVGFAELMLDDVPWPRVSNPLFSPAMLALQWTLIAAAAVTFVAGYATRWRHTPVAMLVLYTLMAATCAYQTLFILTDDSRFTAMAIEYLEYLVILLFLFLSTHARERFGGASPAHPRPPPCQ